PQLGTTSVQPRNHLEISIASIWQKVLKIENIGIYDNFFEIGGHSLLLLQVHSQLCEIFSTNLLVIDLFKYPTISSLADFLGLANTNELSNVHQTEARNEQLKKGKTRINQFLKISKRNNL
uniref:phosphopantetheine-binding protein n=1 Tax=Gloeocapsopsis dulcis TaxID=2859516 RepID=UPI001F3AC4C2